MPSIPSDPVQEGSRWRYHRPSSDEVAAWWAGVPLDPEMEEERAKFVSGVVLIPATEKVKRQAEDRGRVTTIEQHEMTFTPYVRVDTRISYFRTLAAKRDQIAVIEPVEVPRITDVEHPASNVNLPTGFWWYLAPKDASQFVRFLACTMRVALYESEVYFDAEGTIRPSREGVATKQVSVAFGNGSADPNAIAKAETGAIGRALGMAGILVVGTGIATAEDMQEVASGAHEAPTLPESAPEGEMTAEQVSERLLALQAQMQAEVPSRWEQFTAWWTERAGAEGWSSIADAPLEVRRGIVRRMERSIEMGDASPPPSPPTPDSSQGNIPDELLGEGGV